MNHATMSDPAIPFGLIECTPQDAALFQVGRSLQQTGYRFTTVTPDTHAVILARTGNRSARNLREVFGWNLPFEPAVLTDSLLAALYAADMIELRSDGRLRSRIRCSTIDDRLFLHSAYPTCEHDAVFFGPDTYRFVHLLRRTLSGGRRLLEIGAGSGAAALCLAEEYDQVVMTDINAEAVRFARINAALAGCEHAEIRCADLAAQLSGDFAAIIANPPFIIDPAHRLYRDGGDLGIAVAVRMVEAALPLLSTDGCLVLYTGAPVIDGRDQLADALAPVLRRAGRGARYEELDVDVFGSELPHEVYAAAHIERIALVSLVVGRSGAPDTARSDSVPPPAARSRS